MHFFSVVFIHSQVTQLRSAHKVFQNSIIIHFECAHSLCFTAMKQRLWLMLCLWVFLAITHFIFISPCWPARESKSLHRQTTTERKRDREIATKELTSIKIVFIYDFLFIAICGTNNECRHKMGQFQSIQQFTCCFVAVSIWNAAHTHIHTSTIWVAGQCLFNFSTAFHIWSAIYHCINCIKFYFFPLSLNVMKSNKTGRWQMNTTVILTNYYLWSVEIKNLTKMRNK